MIQIKAAQLAPGQLLLTPNGAVPVVKVHGFLAVGERPSFEVTVEDGRCFVCEPTDTLTVVPPGFEPRPVTETFADGADAVAKAVSAGAARGVETVDAWARRLTGASQVSPTCGRRVPYTQLPCAREPGHKGPCDHG